MNPPKGAVRAAGKELAELWGGVEAEENLQDGDLLEALPARFRKFHRMFGRALSAVRLTADIGICVNSACGIRR